MAGFGASFSRLLHSLARPTALAPDGLPFPPDGLIHAVAGTKDAGWFWQGGQLGAQTIDDLLRRQGLGLGDFPRVLDFGCGCGRVIRHLAARSSAPALHGTDYNRNLIRWCRRHLKSADFSVNELAPPTGLADAAFDLVYAFSVFTHLTEALQHAWLAELRRITRPGGCIIITTHGDRYLEKLQADDRALYLRGEMVVWSADSAGQNRCAAFHPPAWVRTTLARRAGLDVLQSVAEGALGNPHQDAWLLQRPA